MNPTKPYIMVILLIVITSALFLNITNWQTKYTPLHLEYQQIQEPIITGMSPTRIGTAKIFFNRPDVQQPPVIVPIPPRVYSYSPPKDEPTRPPEVETPIAIPPKPAEHLSIVPYVLTTNVWSIFTPAIIALLILAIILLKKKKEN